MEWRDEGLIIGVRRHGENSAIVELMTRAHGRHMGIVKGGRSRRMQPVLQPGNTLAVVWRARLEEHLGVYAVEPMRQRAAALMESGLALAGVNLMGAWLRLLPERDPHEGLFEMVDALADHLADARLAPALMARFELAVLSELGFGLDLDQCAATGARDELVVGLPAHGPRRQPRRGRALGRKAPAAAGLPARRLSARGRKPAGHRKRLQAHRLFPRTRRAGPARHARAGGEAGVAGEAGVVVRALLASRGCAAK